jgi:hypothetical protein
MKESENSSNLRNIGNGLQARDEDSPKRDSIPLLVVPVRAESGVQTARISCTSSTNEFDGDSPLPQLKPEDLEEMASIFDKIRLIYKKRDDT